MAATFSPFLQVTLVSKQANEDILLFAQGWKIMLDLDLSTAVDTLLEIYILLHCNIVSGQS